MRVVMLDKPLYAFALEDEDSGNIYFDEEELDNVRVRVNGRPVVLRYGNDEPDDETKRLLIWGSMDINELRQVVDRMTPNQLQNFAADAEERFGVNQLLGKTTAEHLLAAALQLIKERLAAEGLKPQSPERKHSTLPNVISHKQKPGGVNGEVTVVKVSPEEMEKLWK